MALAKQSEAAKELQRHIRIEQRLKEKVERRERKQLARQQRKAEKRARRKAKKHKNREKNQRNCLTTIPDYFQNFVCGSSTEKGPLIKKL